MVFFEEWFLKCDLGFAGYLSGYDIGYEICFMNLKFLVFLYFNIFLWYEIKRFVYEIFRWFMFWD